MSTILLTGATSGIGAATAQALAQQGHHLLLVARDRTRGEALVRTLPRAELLLADLSRQADIHQLARDVRARTDHLNVLINNASAYFAKQEFTVDGVERTFALNHLAYFLLTNLLLDLLRSSAPARIVNVASDAHYRVRSDQAQPPSEGNYVRIYPARRRADRSYKGFQAYSSSKLANVQFTYALARRLHGTGVTVNALHPGVVRTSFSRHEPGLINLFFRLAAPFLLSPERGAATTIYLATSPELAGVSGQYFSKSRPKESSRLSRDDALQERLWHASCDLTHLPR